MSLYTRIIDFQKLQAAWGKVRRNKPASGVDGMTFEQFDSDSKAQIQILHQELKEHRYQTLPVKRVTLYKGEKAREIALYSMRDKVVQQSIATELNKLYDRRFSSQTYAYRPDKSALVAIEEANERIREASYVYALKLDIRHYFDELLWPRLEHILRAEIREDDTIALIKENCTTRMLEEHTGELMEKRRGIHQGSAVSPILSNIYLMEFDHWLLERTPYFIRYSDDLLVLGTDKEDLMSVMREAAVRLEEAGLKLNESKSICVSLEEGVDFLGYHFDTSGKSIPAKAKENLEERLETVWLISADVSFDEKIKKINEIVGGWEQYYREEREIDNIFEFVCLMETLGDDKEADRLQMLKKKRPALVNIYRDIVRYLSDRWKTLHESQLELLEYEQYYQIPEAEHTVPLSEELLGLYRRFLANEDADTALELMQCYTDLREYENAAFWKDKKDILEKESAFVLPPVIPNREDETLAPHFNQQTADKMIKMLVGREDLFSKDSQPQTMPVTDRVIRAHLSGQFSAGTYVQRPNATVRFIVFDIDISKHILLKYQRTDEAFAGYLKRALEKAVAICKLLEGMGLRGYIEYTGNRGYHVWLFLREWIPVRYANMFCEIIEARLETDEAITVEMFPNKTRIKAGKFGQAIRLPYGLHPKSGQRSCFLGEDLQPDTEINLFLDNIASFGIQAIKKILATHTGIREQKEAREVDTDFSIYGDVESTVREVLLKCNLVRFLCLKANKTGYLGHFERLTLLYVFGHLGEAGHAFLHQVMSFTLNYSYNITEKFYRKRPEKPVSCVKLRDQYKKVTAEIGCDCVFKRAKNCYPSPVLHAISRSDDVESDVTLPTSKTLTKEKEALVLDEVNIHKKAQALAKQIQEFRKQKRGLDKEIKKTEKELKAIFDQAGVDELEIEMGLLVRRRTEQGYEWIIEI